MGLAIAQAESRKHDFDCFVDKSAPLPLGRKTFYTMAQIIERISFDVLPHFGREPGVD